MILQSANLILRFILELCALTAVGYWGFKTGKGTITKMVLGIGAPLLIGVIWGGFGSPNATVKLSGFLHLCLELIVFGLPVIALYAAGKSQLAWAYGVTVVMNRLLMFAWGQ